MAALTDWLATPDSREYIRAREGLWVRLVSQLDGSQYISTGATDEEGAWTIDPRPPSGTYIMSIATSSIGPWVPTGYTYEVAVPQADATVVHLTGDETIAGTKTFTSRPVVPDDYVDLANAQTIGGQKTFSARPVLPQDYVDVATDQVVRGFKTFTLDPTFPSDSNYTDVQQNAAQALTAGVFTQLVFGDVQGDPWFSWVTNNQFVASEAGRYQVIGTMELVGSANNVIMAAFWNGIEAKAGFHWGGELGSVIAILRLGVGDIIDIRAYVDTAGCSTSGVGSRNHASFTYLGPL